MVNNDYDKFRSLSHLYMTLFWHRTCTYLDGRSDRFLVLVSNGQVAALSDWAYYHLGFGTNNNANLKNCSISSKRMWSELVQMASWWYKTRRWRDQGQHPPEIDELLPPHTWQIYISSTGASEAWPWKVIGNHLGQSEVVWPVSDSSVTPDRISLIGACI